ncbi:hypothetical protein ACFX4L_23775, partial [Peribacillus sp. YIM B13482]
FLDIVDSPHLLCMILHALIFIVQLSITCPLAQEGKNYKDILNYYYQGVTISSVEPFINKMYVKK